jgi:outer membrane receptor protein involved in Fe transport
MFSRRKAVSLATVLLPQLYIAGIVTAQPAAAPATPPEQPPPAAEPVPEATSAEEGVPRKKVGEEEIVVTGSHIRRKDLTTPAPITIISKEAVQASGKMTIGDYLQSIPEQGNAVNTQQNNGGSGSTRIDLRGLGNVRTLVLLNGRRLVNTGTGGQSGVGADLNTIPTAAVERIEILKDGASAVYGSDAISGVINIITRKSYNGAEANFTSGIAGHGDAFTNNIDGTVGTAGDKGSILFSAGYYNQEPVFAGDRGFSQYQQTLDYSSGNVTNVGSSRAPQGRVTKAAPGSPVGNQTWQDIVARYPTASSFTYDPNNPMSVHGWRPFSAAQVAPPGTLGDPTGDLYNFQPINYDLTPSRRISLFTTGNVSLGESVKAYVEGSYVNRNSTLQLAPEPLIIGSGGAAVTISQFNQYNPFGRDFVTYSKRLVEFGPRTYAASVDSFRVVTGLNGNVSSWNWDVSLNYGRTEWSETDRGHLTTSHLQAAVGPSDSAGHCLTAPAGTPGSTVIAGCVPFNLFQGSAAGGITQDQINYLTFPLVAHISNQMTAVQANIGGELPLKLLSDRPVGLAGGYEYRYEQGIDTPDPVSAAGESTGNNRQETGGHFYVNEAYGELSLPIVSGQTGAENIEATAAVRFVDYSTYGSDWTYKFGGRWTIIRDLTLRGTYSTAFRAPNITELYQGATDNFPSLRDPCATVGGPGTICGDVSGVPAGGTQVTGETQTRTRNSGNSSLQPETAKTWTAGVVIEPRYVKGLSVALDYYNFQIDNAIQPLGGGFILDSCYNGGNLANCAKVIRSPVDHTIDRLNDFLVNIGHISTAGMDLGIRYNLPTQVGRFLFGFDGTWLQHYDITQPDGTLIHGKGNFDVGQIVGGGIGGVYPTFKALTSLFWNYSDFGAGVSERFVGSFTECAAADNTSVGGACYINPTYSRSISAYYQTDLVLSYDIRSSFGKTTIGAGIRNVFDSAPPRIYSAFTPTSDATGYDFIGRFFYGRLTQRF